MSYMKIVLYFKVYPMIIFVVFCPIDNNLLKRILSFRREMIMRAYRPTWLELVSTEGPVRALGFVANRENERIKPNIPLDEQAALIAVATGMLGSNFDYLSDTRRHLQLLGFEDPYIDALYALVCQIISESAAADQ